MRFTWGHAAIAIPVTIVVVFTTVLIRSMADENKTELVVDDYYAKELRFQEQIDKTKNALLVQTNLDWVQNGQNFHLLLSGNFKSENVSGTLVVYRPSDSSLDFEIPLSLDSNGVQVVNGNKFTRGKYQIQVNFTVNDTLCYLEKNIYIP